MKIALVFVKDVARFVAKGCKLVTEAQYRERLSICSTCEKRKGRTCGACGCLLTAKARGKVWDCPLKKWPKLDGESTAPDAPQSTATTSDEG